MKRKITKILGVVLTLSLLVSLAVTMAVPASAGTQAWSVFKIPSATGLVLDTGSAWAGPFAIDINGTAIYMAGENPAAGTGRLYKSTDSGRTWTMLSLAPAYTGGWASTASTITDIVCSSQDANTVYVTDGYDVYKSADGGATWVVLSNLFVSLGLISPISGLITSIDIGYLGTSPYIFAGTSSFSSGTGGAYVAEEAVYGMPWSNLLIATDRVAPWTAADVLVVRVDPTTFASTQMVMAIASDTTGGLHVPKLTTKYSGAQWAQNAGDVTLPGISGGNAWLFNASLWLPDDFNSNLASGLMQAFVGVTPNLNTLGDVYLAAFAVAASNAVDLNAGGPGTSVHISGLDGIGGASTASLLATGFSPSAIAVPRVFRTFDGGLSWAPDLKAPTGGASPFVPGGWSLSSILVLETDTTNNIIDALCATHGTNSGVSVTNDFGATWNGASKMNATIVTVDDLALGSVFISTSGATDDIWRSDGTNWERVFSGTAATVAGFALDRDPAGTAIFAADLGGTTILRSINNGQTWAPLVSAPAGNISAFAATSVSNVLVGSGTNLYQTPNFGVIWFTRTHGVGTILSFAKDAGGDIIIAGTTGLARSQDGGVTWTTFGDPWTPASTAVSAAFSSSYATDSKVYVTGDQGGIWVYDFSATTPAWTQLDVSAITGKTVVTGAGLVAAPGGPDGMVYAAEANANGAGVIRLKANRLNAEQMADTTAPVPAAVLRGLWYEAGSNKLYTLAGNSIRTYTDILAVSGSGVSISAVTIGSATISWSALPGALTYTITVKTGSQATNVYPATVTWTGAGTSRTVTGLAPNTTYSVSVWAFTPVTSFLFSGTSSFATLPGAILAPPQNLIPAHGAINIPVDGPAFAWGAPAGGATSYKWQLSTDPSFVEITEGEVITTLTFLVWPGPLEFEQDYYWRVQATTAAGTGPWATQVFTTVAEALPVVTVPPAPTPTITVSIPPAVTQPAPTITVSPPDIIVTIPQPTTTIVTITQDAPIINIPEDETPVYIWVIVAIGALLTIAVIVLIVRTRRVV